MYPHATEDSTNDRRQADTDELDGRRDEYGEHYDRAADQDGSQHEDAAYTTDTTDTATDTATDPPTDTEQGRADGYTEHDRSTDGLDSAESDRADSAAYSATDSDTESSTSNYDSADQYDTAHDGTADSTTQYDSTHAETAGYGTAESDSVTHDTVDTTEHDRTPEYADTADTTEHDRTPEYADTADTTDTTDTTEYDRTGEYPDTTADQQLTAETPEPAYAGAATAAGTSLDGQTEQRAPQAVEEDWQLFGDHDRTELHSRWAEVQGSFVDDPRQALEQAEHLVSELVQSLTDRFNERKAELVAHDTTDTEDLRLAMRRYRVFFRQVLGG